MGIEFIRRIAQTFKKAIDRERIRLNTPQLFRDSSAKISRSIAFDIMPGSQISVGEELLILNEGPSLIATRMLEKIATAENPASVLLEAITSGGGETAIGKVIQINEISNVAEVELC